jgi:hypothetical protein
MLDIPRREFIALVGGGGLLLTANATRARAQQPTMPVVGLRDRLADAVDRQVGDAGSQRNATRARIVFALVDDPVSSRGPRR